jgi:hypothetical protein
MPVCRHAMPNGFQEVGEEHIPLKGVYCVLRKDVNPNRCNYLYFDRSKFTYLCKKQ